MVDKKLVSKRGIDDGSAVLAKADWQGATKAE
jgi:hypothetical protein